MGVAYNKDFYGWANEQAQLLKAGAFGQLDVVNLIEEVESMGRKELSELRNRLRLLISHMLKCQYQPERKGRSWELTIKGQRRDIAMLIKDSPSLKHPVGNPDFLPDVWVSAVFDAARETGISEYDFPQSPIWTLDEILDDNFLP